VTEVRDRRRIAASPREVWRVLSEFERYAEWGAWTRAVQRVDRPAGLGAAYHEHSRLLAPMVVASRWRIIEFDPPRRQVHRAESAPLAARFDRVFELASDGMGGTWLTLGVRYRPALGIAGRLVDRVALRAVQARRLAHTLESIERLTLRPRPAAVL
jgi:polyketide cyclase/dehydrase/lipid transport protein